MLTAVCAISARAQSAVTSVELLGVTTANQAANGLGFVVPQANQDWEFAAAAAAGAHYVRFQCAWSNVEKQTAPPNNQPASPQFVQDPNCVAGYAAAKKYGLTPIVVAAYGPPYHKILTVAISSAAAAGDKSITVRFVSGVGGDTLANVAFPYDYIRRSDGTMFTNAHNYQGSFITSVTLLDSTHAKLGLSSALTTALPVSSSTTYDINEILYPSATTANANDASQVEFGNYVSFLAQDMAARGLSGQIEIWNEPAWADDSWDARGYLYDNFPSGQTWSPNYGFAANLQARQMPAGVTLNWGGTHKSGSNSLFFGPFQPTPMRLATPSVVFSSESFHPYGNTPEQMMWTTTCLQQSLRIPVSPSAYQGCTLPGEKADSNFMWAAQYNMAAKMLNANAGLTQSITETGIIPPGPGLRSAQARFNMRQFLGYQALGITPVTFYAISDLTQTGDPNYSFVEPAAGGTYTPDPSFTAMSGFMADIKPVSNAPVTPYSTSTLAQVSVYSGTYPLTSLHLVGARSGATANSDVFLLWQRSYTQGCATSSSNDAPSCDSPWIRQASPSAGSATVTIPTGSHVTSVVNVDTRATVAFTSAGQQVTFVVADDPIEIVVDPVLPPAATTLTTQANPSSPAYGNQVVLSAVLTPYNSSSASTNGETVSFFDGSTGLGAGTLSSGLATLDVTSLAIGSHTLTARYGGDAGFAASTGTASITVSPLAPALTLGQIADQVYDTGPLTVSASSNSNGAISYSVASGPATVAGNQVTLTGVGTVALVASQVAAGNYAAATAQGNFNVTPATPSLKFAAIPDQVYGAGPLTISASSNSTGAISYSVLSGPATFSANQVTLTGAGTVVLVVSQAAAGNYAAATTQTSFNVSAAASSLKLAPIADQVYGAGPITVSASSNSTATITYAITSGSATIAGNQVTPTGIGSVVLTASQPAVGNYAAATAQTSFNVTAATPSLKLAAIADQVYGASPFTVSASSNSTGSISYSVTKGPATIAGSLLTLTGTGTVVLTASQVAAGNYSAAATQTSFHVTAATPSLKFSAITDQVYGAVPFTVTASSNSTGAISYSVASGPATVAGNQVSLTGTGTVVLVASQVAAGNYASATVQTSFNVTTATPSLKFAAIADQVYGAASFTVTASSNSTGAISYAVASGPATVAGNQVSLTGTGTVVLVANQVAAGNYASATAQTSFNVTASTSTLKFAAITDQVYGAAPLTVSAVSNSTGAISYSVLSGPATVAGNQVTLTGIGTVTLVATQAAAGNYAGATAQTSFNVTPATPSLKLAVVPDQVYGAGPVTVDASSNSAGAIVYAVTSGPATIAGNTVTPTGVGTVVLTASQAAAGNYATATAHTSFNVTTAAPSLKFAAIADQVYGAGTITANASSNSSGAISYTVSSGPATISGSQISPTGIGTVVLTASQVAAGNYASASAQTSFNITGATPSLKFAAISDQVYGEAPFTITASSNSTGAISYAVVTGPATVAGNQVTLNGVGSVELVASQAAAGNYMASTAQTSFNVTTAPPSLKFAAISDQVYGAGPLTVSASSNSTGAISYAITSGPATVTGNLVTLTGIGTVVLSASQTATGNYAAATAQTSFNVTAATPSLKFAVIADQVYGAGTITANASSSSSGAISYSVLSGPATVAGSQVTSTATGTVVLIANQIAAGNYSAATAQTSFNVTAATPTLKFAAIADQVYGVGTLTISASSNSNGVISYSVASGPATVAGNQMTLIGTGSVVLMASQAAAGNYASATAQTSFNVTAGTTTLTFVPIADQMYGAAPFTIQATSNSTGAITYTVATGPASITANQVTLAGIGTVVINANQAAGGNYAAASAQVSFHVNPAQPALAFTPIADQVYGSSPISISAGSNSTGAITYAVTSGPATLAGSQVTFLGTGTVVLTANQAAAGNYTVATTQTSFHVMPTMPVLQIASIPDQVYGAGPVTISATSNSSGVISYAMTSGPASVSGNQITLTGTGMVVLVASQAAAGNFLAASAQTTFNVTAPAAQASFTLSATGLTNATITSGSTATYALALNSAAGATGTVALACSGAPAGMNCAVSPSTLQLGGTDAFTVTLSPAAVAVMDSGKSSPSGHGGLLLAMLPIALLGFRRRVRKALAHSRNRLLAGMLLVVALFTSAGMCGCGSGIAIKSASHTVPTGSYVITVTANKGQETHTMQLSLTID